MILQIILADILLIARIFPCPWVQKYTTQLVKYPPVLSVKPSNKVYLFLIAPFIIFKLIITITKFSKPRFPLTVGFPNCYRTVCYGQFVIGQFVIGQFFIGQFLIGQFVTGQFVIGQFVVGQFVVGQFVVGQFVVGQFVIGQFVIGQFVIGQFVIGQFTRHA